MVLHMGMETVGKLHTIFETKQVSERFSKREFVVELTDNPKYPQTVLFQLTGDRCAILDDFKVGDAVMVEFSLRGREWRSPAGETKYFNSLDVWKVEPARGAANVSSSRGGRNTQRGVAADPRSDAAPARDYEPRPSDLGGGGDMDDLPF
jgi:hypothetical protein